MTLHFMQQRLRSVETVARTGRVRRILPTYIEADGPMVALGARCLVEAAHATAFQAQVVRVNPDSIILTPLEEGTQTFSGAKVTALMHSDRVSVGQAFLSRAVDALERPLDSKPPVLTGEDRVLLGTTTAPLDRTSPAEVLETGIRLIDGILTLGKGQRVGIFAASGVGKTTLLSQIARQVKADIVILCVVGERGREVETIWNHELDEAARSRATLVAATSDQSAAMRVRAGHYALALAEYWRDRGRHVLLLLDSVTRLAMAMRELGLAAGEPPTLRAYTPSVFATIPKMIERCGALKSGGAITAVVTVLSESDDVDDPVCEMMKSLLDGHIVLSRSLAAEGRYPAVDVLRSISRLTDHLVDEHHRRHISQVVDWLSCYESSKTLVDAGLYAAGGNPRIDRSLERHPEIVQFLKQERHARESLASTQSALRRLVEELR